MGLQIDMIELGLGQTYVIRDQGAIIVDGGDAKKAAAFEKGIENLSIKADDIKLMVITHGHFDHIGSAAEIKKLTGAQLAMHELEKEWLEKGLKPLPHGFGLWGSALILLMKLIFIPTRTIPPAIVDIALNNDEFSLADYGIAGKILHTPGHSPGSVSVLLETGDAFVGDLAMNKLPLRFSPGLPAFGESMETIKYSWRLLLEQGAKMVYPAHGNPFSVDVIEKALAKSV